MPVGTAQDQSAGPGHHQGAGGHLCPHRRGPDEALHLGAGWQALGGVRGQQRPEALLGSVRGAVGHHRTGAGQAGTGALTHGREEDHRRQGDRPDPEAAALRAGVPEGSQWHAGGHPYWLQREHSPAAGISVADRPARSCRCPGWPEEGGQEGRGHGRQPDGRAGTGPEAGAEGKTGQRGGNRHDGQGEAGRPAGGEAQAQRRRGHLRPEEPLRR
ncbi:hypothetical protein G6F65_010200 [Rhizopus arrhizus]|nr:hypothetical protein G6F65_010200 [Rhizopus arrhizus]